MIEVRTVRCVALLFMLGAAFAGAGCGAKEKVSVVVYAAQDQVYAEPVLKQFERTTGIRVGAVYDSEAVKTVGLANRLLAERSRPLCDVYWGNEELRTRQLAAAAVFRETNGWASFGSRSRRLVINTSRLSPAQAPATWLELTNRMWQGRIAMAYPLFGTTATHLLALRHRWGESAWQSWCRALAANRPLVVDGNSVVVQFVGRGEAWIGLTDSDDIVAGQQAGLPVAALPLSSDALAIPNTVGVIRNCPHPEPAQKLFEFLQQPWVAAQLAEGGALESAVASEIRADTLRPDWETLLDELDSATAFLMDVFRR